MIILVDMDGPLADFETEFLRRYREQYPDKPYVPIGERKDFEIYNDYPADMLDAIIKIYNTPGFFAALPPVRGGLEALKAMGEKGLDVLICTAPVTRLDSCADEKVQWVLEHLGRDWKKRLIISKDKTLVRGDILIDDRPEIHGRLQPTWEHVLYNMPYNTHVNGKRRLNWGNYQQVLGL